MTSVFRTAHDYWNQLAGRLPQQQTPKRWVGLDLGTQSIKVVELERTASGVRLVKSLIQELPTAQAGQPVDRAGWLQSALKEFDADQVHVSVSGSEVAIRRVHMPLMAKHELLEAVKWQVKDQLPFPVQEAVFDCSIIGEVWDKDIKKQDVLVAAASRPFVRELIALVERSGARVASLVPAHLAAWRCAVQLVPEAMKGSVAVIEVGAADTKVTIGKDGQIRLVRDLAVGSASVTDALVGVVPSEKGEITIDPSKAEALKRRYGVLTDDAEGATEEGVPLFHLSFLMRPVLESLLTELSRVANFYKVQMEEAGVSRALLCGGGASLKQLQPFLSEGLGVTMEVLNPLIRIPDRAQPSDPTQVAEGGPRLAVAIGAALEHGQGLNLVPAETRRSGIPAISRRVWMKAAKAAGALALAAYLGLWFTAGLLQWQVRGRQKIWDRLKPAYTQAMDASLARRTLEGELAQLQQFIDQQPVWEGIFKELGELMPVSVQLSEMSAETGGRGNAHPMRIRLKGAVASGSSTGQGSMAKFMEALEESVFFSDVELASSEMHSSQSGETSFEIEGSLE